MNILFFSNDGKLGDAVLHTALVKGIKEGCSESKIYCMTAGSTTDFWKRDSRIEKSWDFWKPSFWQAIKLGLAVRKEKLDYIISWNPIKNEKLKIFCWLANPKFGTKVFIVKPDEHASIKEKRVLDMLGYHNTDVSYDIPSSIKMTSYQWKENSLFFNIFASIDSRTISVNDAVILLNLLMDKIPDTVIYMTYYAGKKDVIDEIISKTINKNVVAIDCSDNMDKLFSLCKNVKVVISPDTAIVHVASSYNKPIIALFEKGNILLQTNWAPKSDHYSIIDFFANQDEKISILSKIADLAVSYIKK